MRPLLFALAGALTLHSQTNPDPTATFTKEDLARGKKLFIGHCAPCHGIDGHGGRGANLAVAHFKRASDNTALFDVARNGIEGSSMDANWQLSDGELWRVVAFVRSIGQESQVPLPGDPERGQQVYLRQNCASCHIVAGQGSGFGPELTSIGAQRSAKYLEESIVRPEAAVPEEFTTVLIATREGRQIRGIRVNEDSFTIQIKNPAGRYESFRKADLVKCEVDPSHSMMPSYASTITGADLTDLVAYLASLRGAK